MATAFKTRMRMERAARMEALGHSDVEIALQIGLTPAGLATLKQDPDYGAIRLSVMNGIIASFDEEVGEDIKQMRQKVRAAVPAALQAIIDTIHSKDPKLRLQAAGELLDRDGRLVKASRNIVATPEEHANCITSKDDEIASELVSASQKPTSIQ